MTFLRISLILLLLVSCKKGLRFDPDFYVPSMSQQALINEDGVHVKFSDTRIGQYGCMSKSKIIELKILLRNAQPLKSSVVENLTTKKLKKLIKRFEKK